jgi:4-amino-4-deoxy-L-arabinose transferase-like glycosyltransferase
MNTKIFRYCVWGLVFVSIILLLVSIPNHDFYVDEAFIGEYSYYFARDGFVHSTFWEGYLRQDEYVVLHHQFATWSGAAMIRLFGAHLWSVRFVSLSAGLITFFLIWRLTGRYWRWEIEQRVLALAVLLCIPSFFYHVKCFRPEVETAAFGLLSFYALWVALMEEKSSERKRIFAVSIAGLSSGAAMLTHLAGCMYAGAGLFLLLKERRLLWVSIFGVAVLLVFSPYPIDVWLHRDLAFLQASQPQAQAKFAFQWWTPFLHLLNEQERFFRKPQFIFTSVLCLVLVAVTWRSKSPRRTFLRTYCAALVVVLGVMLEDKRDYFALYAPFLALFIADAAPDIWSKGRITKILCGVCAIVFVGYGVYFQATDALHKENVSELNREITRSIPDGARCLAPLNLMYDEIGRLHLIAFNQAFATLEGDRPTITAGSLKHFCDIRAIEYVIMNRFGEERDVIADAETNAAMLDSAFSTIRRTNDYWLLQRRKH